MTPTHWPASLLSWRRSTKQICSLEAKGDRTDRCRPTVACPGCCVPRRSIMSRAPRMVARLMANLPGIGTLSSKAVADKITGLVLIADDTAGRRTER